MVYIVNKQYLYLENLVNELTAGNTYGGAKINATAFFERMNDPSSERDNDNPMLNRLVDDSRTKMKAFGYDLETQSYDDALGHLAQGIFQGDKFLAQTSSTRIKRRLKTIGDENDRRGAYNIRMSKIVKTAGNDYTESWGMALGDWGYHGLVKLKKTLSKAQSRAKFHNFKENMVAVGKNVLGVFGRKSQPE